MSEFSQEPIDVPQIGASAGAASRDGRSPRPAADRDEEQADSGAGYRFRGYSKDVVDRVWQMAEVVEGNDPAVWRKDEFGAWIHRLDYGNRRSDFGWEVCETLPGSSRTMGVASLRAMHWQNYLDQVAAASQSRITADGLRNVRHLL